MDLKDISMMAIVNSGAVNMDVVVSLLYADFDFFGYIARSGIAGSYGNSIFSFLMNPHIDLLNDYTNLYSHQQCIRVPHYPCQPLLGFCCCFVLFLIVAILTQVRWNLSVVLVCISLMVKDVEHFSCIYWPFGFILLKKDQFICPLCDWIISSSCLGLILKY
jgi:hypothetical protein